MHVLRLPFAAGSGVLVALSVFTLLWRFVDVPMELETIESERVSFTRQLFTSPIATKRDPKIERTPPVLPPPRVGSGRTEVDPPTMVAVTDFTGPAIGHGGGISLRGTDHDPIPMVRVPPEYPPSAITRNLEGWVLVRFSITVAGTVRDATVVSAEPRGIFDQAALKAIARWRYNPRVVDGAAAERVGMETVIRFNLKDSR